ncbi:MAG: response regulator [Roseburia sp.]|jgi:two-component system response regulator YesN|nr:response regulator [Roseburia sp.]
MNILLVDDNIYTIRALQSGINYSALGISGVYTARSMEKAIEWLKQEEIPLVLTDIEMPNGTGLQLLEWINENKPGTVTLFCTSYANFDYAKKAVELHSFDYYLKPIQYEDLQKLLEKAVEEVKKRARSREKEQYETYWNDNIRTYKSHFWEDALFWVDSYDEEELEFLAESRHLPYSREDRFTAGILRFEKEKSRMSDFPGNLERFVAGNIMTELCEHAGLRMEMFLKCRRDTWALVFSHGAQLERAQMDGMFRMLLDNLERVLQCSVSVCYAYGCTFQDVRGRYMLLEDFCREHAPRESYVVDIDRFAKRMYEMGEPGEAQRAECAIRKVKQYIDEHFCENITRDTLGEIVYLSPGYLAATFKKVIGSSLGSYIIEKRMEKAKDLLAEGNLTVSEVAFAVGYDNFTYFSRLFKNKVGIMPKEYRKGRKK